jgi:hypothetical protein
MFEAIELNESKKIMKSLNVIIYGTIRDIEEHFTKSFANIYLLCKLFNKVYIIIFENDSSDNTRNLLTSWSKFNNVNITKHIILENNLTNKIPLRATRLAYCRNKILNHIFENNLDKTYQYAIHCDLDDRFWSLDYESICNCFQYELNTWDAMFPINKNYSYYDYWALRCNQTWFNKNIFSCQIENNDNYNQYENHISEFSSFLKNNKNSLINVNSAFNGIGIYKLKSLQNCKYNANFFCNNCKGKKQGCYEDNDHIGLHRDMIFNNYKLFINTKMVLENNKKYISYKKFIKNLEYIHNIKKDPLKYVFYTKMVDQNHLWLNFSNELGNYENIISNFTTNNIITFCRNDNNLYSNDLINNNVIKYIYNIDRNINKFILNNYNSFISFIHIDFNNYHNTKLIFDKLHQKMNNGCIIVINKFINHGKYLFNNLHAFYEFTQKYNITFEYIGINGQFFVNPDHNLNVSTSVAIRIINNPNISNIIITDDFYKYEEDYINFNWKKYIEINNDLNHVKNKEEAWDHWINHGKNEGRKCCLEEIETKIETIKTIDKNIENEKNMFDWKKYIEINNDLNHVKNKEEAWDHWINHGKNEGRNFYIKSKYNTFDWKYYVQINTDLSHITTEEEALKHWNEFGKKEGRSFSNKNFINFNNFDWRYYIVNNKDLKELQTKEKAWDHWDKYGKYENRLFKKKLKKIDYIF